MREEKPFSDISCRHFLVHVGCMDILPLFAKVELENNVFIAVSTADADTGRNDLREAEQTNDDVIFVKALDRGFGITGIAELCIRIIFQNKDAVFAADLTHFASSFCRHRSSCRVLERRDRIDEFGIVCLDLCFKVIHAHTVFIHFDFDDVRFKQLEGLQCAEEGRRFDKNGITLLDESLCHQVNTLRRP